MKRIGLLGGFSWHSTIEYYRLLNQMVGDKIGRTHGAELALINCDSQIFKTLIDRGDRQNAIKILQEAAQKAEKAGADFLLMCANGLHRFFEPVQQSINIPILHIVDAVGAEIQRKSLKKVGLLGVRPTMEESFYPDRLGRFGIDVLVPSASERSEIHDLIYSEMEVGKFIDSTRKKFLGFIDNLVGNGAEGVILGCTEIPLLVRPSDTLVTTFSTTEIHCRAAVIRAFE